jgi:hypothetical protein
MNRESVVTPPLCRPRRTMVEAVLPAGWKDDKMSFTIRFECGARLEHGKRALAVRVLQIFDSGRNSFLIGFP